MESIGTGPSTEAERYSAPEILRPDGFGDIDPDASSDVYAFGMVCWQVRLMTSFQGH